MAKVHEANISVIYHCQHCIELYLLLYMSTLFVITWYSLQSCFQCSWGLSASTLKIYAGGLPEMLVTINENNFITHRTTIQIFSAVKTSPPKLLYVVLTGISEEIMINSWEINIGASVYLNDTDRPGLPFKFLHSWSHCPAPRYSPEHFILLCPQIYILTEKPQRVAEKE